MLSFGVGFFAFIAFSIAFRRSLQARAESEQLLAELTSAQGRLRDIAVMEERQRLAREMHDAVGHRLTAAAVLLEGAARLIRTEPARATRMVETVPRPGPGGSRRAARGGERAPHGRARARSPFPRCSARWWTSLPRARRRR